MRRAPRLSLLSLPLSLAGLVACSSPPAPIYTFGGNPSGASLSGGSSSTMPGAPTDTDGGLLVDGGVLPTSPCPGADNDGTASGPPSGLVISQLGLTSPGFIEIYNRGSSSVDLSTYTLEGSLTGQLATGTLTATTRSLVPATLPATSGELALFTDVDAGSAIVFYTCWGPLGTTTLQTQAITAQLWQSPGVCPLIPPTDDSLHLTGNGTQATDWTAGAPTPDGCAE